MKSIIVLLIFILVVGFIWSMIKKWEKELLIEANELRQKKTNLNYTLKVLVSKLRKLQTMQ